MKNKAWIIPVLGVLILLFFLVSPPIAPLTKLGMKVVGIFLFTVIWWVSVGVGYPSIKRFIASMAPQKTLRCPHFRPTQSPALSLFIGSIERNVEPNSIGSFVQRDSSH